VAYDGDPVGYAKAGKRSCFICKGENDLVNLTTIEHLLNTEKATCRAIIETPKGSRSKYTYDPELEILELSGLLPAGMSFPLDFGFIPNTLAEDGDPLDVLVIGDEPSAVGCFAEIKIMGVIEANQTEKGETARNDRLVARIAKSITYGHASHIDDLGKPFVEHLGKFFVNYNELKGRSFEVLDVAGPDRAMRLIEKAAATAARNRSS
jgi:inorganic pyrophosphatase